MPNAFTFSEYGGPETQALVERPKPEPGPGEVLIAVRAAAVNPVDWKMRAGHLKAFMPLELPAVLGREASGVVESVGDGVTNFAAGDEVFGNTPHGSFAEYAVLTAASTGHKPAAVSFNDAASLPVGGGTAYDAVQQIGPKDGDILLITGAGGGVGVAAVQLALRAGARVIGTASPSKHDLLRRLGAEPVAYGAGVEERVRALAPDGVTAIFDLIGGDDLRAVAPVLADPSRLVTGADPATAGELGGVRLDRHPNTETYETIAALVAEGAFDPLVTSTYPLARAADAMAEVEAGHATGKVVITVP
ncbi:MAG TPA: NADP-dependent oxidoreductase [Acidimicrobiales bacterium]|jgi:NADPH:quinone reductase-like Zn-dependent oxidoreductase